MAKRSLNHNLVELGGVTRRRQYDRHVDVQRHHCDVDEFVVKIAQTLASVYPRSEELASVSDAGNNERWPTFTDSIRQS